jgi:peptide/nickel transport system permease protein
MVKTKTIAFVSGKIVRIVSLLAALCVVSFVLVSHSPIDPVQAYVGADVMRVGMEQRELIKAHWGLDQPPLTRFVRWAGSLARLDLGVSMIYRAPVISVIGERFTASLALMAAAWFFSGAFGFMLGIAAAMNQGRWADRIISGYCLLLASTPTFWLGLLFLMFFSVKLGWFPIGLGIPAGMLPEDVSLGQRAAHLVLPALTLCVTGVAGVALHTRQKLIDVLASDFILFARARGKDGWTLLRHHGLRNILLPAVSLHFASFSELFGGSVLAEQVFSYPGLGQATVQAGLRGDVPLLLGIILFSAVFVFIGNFIADLLYVIIDPRIREAKSL